MKLTAALALALVIAIAVWATLYTLSARAVVAQAEAAVRAA